MRTVGFWSLRACLQVAREMEQEALRKAAKARKQNLDVERKGASAASAASHHHISIMSDRHSKKPPHQAKEEREEAQVEHELLSWDYFGNSSVLFIRIYCWGNLSGIIVFTRIYCFLRFFSTNILFYFVGAIIGMGIWLKFVCVTLWHVLGMLLNLTMSRAQNIYKDAQDRLRMGCCIGMIGMWNVGIS